MSNKNHFGSTLESVVYPVLLLIILWAVFWADHLFPQVDFYKLGVKPKSIEGIKGILFMPVIHSKSEIGHIVNNSFPTAILLGTIIYYYREVALRVFVLSWILTGFGVLVFAQDTNSYHIGISGLVYAMASFLFVSGVIRKHRPLQAISLFVAFLYGSLIWGIFPIKEHMSWEGHLMGLLSGVLLAFLYRRLGPQPPKYLYEIEKELGIEPPDLEGQWNERLRREKEREEEIRRQHEGLYIQYHYVPSKKTVDSKDDSDLK